MSKKTILIVSITAFLLVLGGVLGNKIVRADRDLPFANDIYRVSPGGATGSYVQVGVFDDKGNKCYVAYGTRSIDPSVAIDCVGGER
jgi:hypothetical protein